jgi:hypothetical protein
MNEPHQGYAPKRGKITDAILDLANKIEIYVNQSDNGVLFTDLEKDVPGFIASNKAAPFLGWIRVQGRVFWKVSQDVADAIEYLFDQKRICYTTATHMEYLISAVYWNFPPAKQWAPIALKPKRFANFTAMNGWLLYVPPEYMADAKKWKKVAEKSTQ